MSEAAAALDRRRPTAGRRAVVLVALPDDALRDVVSEAVAREGACIEQARSASALRRRLGRAIAGDDALPDLVVWDVRLAGLGALDALLSLRAYAGAPNIVFVGEEIARDDARRAQVVGPLRWCERSEPSAVTLAALELLDRRRRELAIARAATAS